MLMTVGRWRRELADCGEARQTCEGRRGGGGRDGGGDGGRWPKGAGEEREIGGRWPKRAGPADRRSHTRRGTLNPGESVAMAMAMAMARDWNVRAGRLVCALSCPHSSLAGVFSMTLDSAHVTLQGRRA
ncbi:hypothetical protein AcV5_002364 [Taiwanofungus camphoratus]|nr:hypothetical protein AcV5_002364 [Antrodia cinnamomea]